MINIQKKRMETKNVIIIGLSLPWISVVIGGTNGLIVTGDINGFLIGIFLGILVSLCIYLGFILVLGVVIYHFAVSFFFHVVDLDLVGLYVYGMIVTVFYTAVMILFLLVGHKERMCVKS